MSVADAEAGNETEKPPDHIKEVLKQNMGNDAGRKARTGKD